MYLVNYPNQNSPTVFTNEAISYSHPVTRMVPSFRENNFYKRLRVAPSALGR
jgi:hypothetical protein